MPQIRQFKLPDVGEGLTEGEILQWLVAVGDTVVVNQPIVEVETAKAAVELPCPYAGIVTELIYEPGTTVDVGAPIISIDVDPGGSPAQPAFNPPSTALPPSAATLAEVEIAGEEEAIEPGLIGGPAPGGRTSILVGYGPRTTEAKRRPRTQNAEIPPRVLATAPDVQSKPVRHGGVEMGRAVEVTVQRNESNAALAKPLVRKYAKSLGVDLGTLTGSGPHGSITRADVDGVARVEPPAAAPGDQRIPIKGVRKHTAAAMVASAFTAPHVTEWVSIDVTPMMKLRERVAAHRDFRGVKVSPLLFVAKVLLLAIARHPMINSSWDEKAQEIVVKAAVNLGIAAATPRGLIVPNVKDAGSLSLLALAEALTALTETARAGKTQPADMSGGTITITNVGVFGVDSGTPILNPGESAILVFGAIREQPWVHKGKIKVRQVTQLGLSFDHRIVDGELGSRFLADVAAILSDPGMALAF